VEYRVQFLQMLQGRLMTTSCGCVRVMQARNDGGTYRLLDELTRATTAISVLCSTTDVDNLMLTLFNQNLSQMQQPGYDPIVLLTQQQRQQQQHQQQQQQQQQIF